MEALPAASMVLSLDSMQQTGTNGMHPYLFPDGARLVNRSLTLLQLGILRKGAVPARTPRRFGKALVVLRKMTGDPLSKMFGKAPEGWIVPVPSLFFLKDDLR